MPTFNGAIYGERSTLTVEIKDPWIDFRGTVNLDGKKITTLFSLNYN
jgi:hypothetical protein